LSCHCDQFYGLFNNVNGLDKMTLFAKKCKTPHELKREKIRAQKRYNVDAVFCTKILPVV